jgi:hypothetical protein
MKKSVILAILGLSVAAVSSYGQGSIAFNTYVTHGGSGTITTYGNGLIGPIDNTFHGELLWSLTDPGDAASTALTAGNPLNPAWQVASVGTFNSPAAIAPGYIAGPNWTYTGTGGVNLFFEIVAFNGSAWGNGTYQGHSASFAATLVTGVTLPSADQLNNMQPFQVFQVASVPEPATMALGGLGLASLLLFRRKQA